MAEQFDKRSRQALAARTYRERHPERVAAYARAYRSSHLAERTAYNVAYYAAHHDAQLAIRRARKEADPWDRAKEALRKARGRARRRGLDVGSLTKEIFARLHLLPCVYCGVMPALGVDHVVPFARGGTNGIENLAPACLPCNQAKQAKAI